MDNIRRKCASQHSDQEHLWKQMESQEEMKGLIQEMASESSCSNVDLRIVLLGKTGTGKSSTGNTISGNFVFKTDSDMSSNSITSQCQKHLATVEDRKLSVIDTPGLFDTSMSKENLKAEIVKCVYMSAPGPHVFLLVMSLDMRYTNEEKNTVKWIQENFGEEASRYTIILFTRGDQLKRKTLDDYISENNDLKALVNMCGDRSHLFNNKDMKKRSQVTELLEKIEKMVKENGGQHYTNETYRKAQEKIEWEAQKQRVKRYGITALAVIGGGAVVAGAVTAAGGPAAVAAAAAAAGGEVAAVAAAAAATVAAAGGEVAAVAAAAGGPAAAVTVTVAAAAAAAVTVVGPAAGRPASRLETVTHS